MVANGRAIESPRVFMVGYYDEKPSGVIAYYSSWIFEFV